MERKDGRIGSPCTELVLLSDFVPKISSVVLTVYLPSFEGDEVGVVILRVGDPSISTGHCTSRWRVDLVGDDVPCGRFGVIFAGAIPPSIGELRTLTSLDLRRNHLSGKWCDPQLAGRDNPG